MAQLAPIPVLPNPFRRTILERKPGSALYQAVLSLDDNPGDRRRAPAISDRIIVAVYLWAVLHDRPTAWACCPYHWPDRLVPWALPSQPTLSRRLRTPAVRRLLNAVRRPFGGPDRPWWDRALDRKPLPVGGCSKDPDARLGRRSAGWFRGYRLHAIWGGDATPDAWEVLPADRGEPTVARVRV